MKKLAVDYLPTDALKPYARNPKTHSEAQVQQIAASIREFGFTQPILLDGRKGVVAGHGRLLAAKALGMAEVPTIQLRGLSAAQKRAYIIADNKLAENAGWDEGLLAEELGALAEAGFALELTGFDGVEVASLLAGNADGLTDPDYAPGVPADPVARLGDIWACGGHRLICGDATVPETVAALLGSVKPHLMVTDPPYGVEYNADWRNHAFRKDGSAIGGRAVGEVQNDDQADWSPAYILFPGDVAYVWHPPGARQVEFFTSLCASGFDVRMQIIWAKSHFPIGRGNYHVQHEPCWYAVRNGKTAHWSGDRKQSTLWQIEKPQKSETGHSTQKPVECMKRPIVNNSSPGQAVYDPFLGSGTTLIAAEMEGRACYGCEVFPAYVDVTVRRWQDFTGREATLDGDGRSFAEIASERGREAA